MSQMVLEPLANPPIDEVVCGFVFDSLPSFDPIILGQYWERVRERYPSRILHPALVERGGDEEVFFQIGGVGQIRVWFVSQDDVFVIQVQHDRFYLNWRRRGRDYPRFSDHDTRDGLLTLALREFDVFTQFCLGVLGVSPSVRRVELSKIDLLEQGVHWTSRSDLAALLPALGPVLSLGETDAPNVALRLAEKSEGASVTVAITSARRLRSEGADEVSVLRLETRVVNDLARGTSIRAVFESANQQANSIFARLVPAEERTRRFQLLDA